MKMDAYYYSFNKTGVAEKTRYYLPSLVQEKPIITRIHGMIRPRHMRDRQAIPLLSGYKMQPMKLQKHLRKS